MRIHVRMFGTVQSIQRSRPRSAAERIGQPVQVIIDASASAAPMPCTCAMSATPARITPCRPPKCLQQRAAPGAGRGPGTSSSTDSL